MYHTQETGAFVPFCETVIRRYTSFRELPPHDVMDPRLLHGEIHLTLTARTPVIVSGGRHFKEGAASVSLFATDAYGRYRIPGSSLRGLIRQNMQILGLGLVRVGREDEIPNLPVANNGRPADGLPQSYRIPEDQDFLDYPRSIMGFVGRKHSVTSRYGKPKWVSDCYRTRISIGDLHAVGTPRELHTVLLQQELPRQDSDAFIIQENGRFRLKGTRQYPLREVSQNQPYFSKQGFRPLAAGSQFTGTIRYRNLHADELGLLLWCLRLQEGCLHTMGMAKAAGYGQLELKIDSLVEYDPAQLYSSLTVGGISRGETGVRIDALINAYQDYAVKQTNIHPTSLLEMPHIRTFLKLKGWQPQTEDQTAAVTSKPAAPPKPPAPSQKELRKQAKKEARPQASAEEVRNLRAMLSSHFKGN